MASRFYNLSTDNTLGGVSPSDAIVSSQKAIKDYVDGKSPDIDNSTITMNASDELQSNAVVNQNSGIVKTWTGTLQEYENILNKDSSTTYIITDDEVGGETVYTKNQTDSKIDEKISKNNHEITTNCITEIPQDIKLELSSGILTLKAGSKVYVPNGVGVFDEAVIASDVSVTPGSSLTSGSYLLFYNGTGFDYYDSSDIVSGVTDPMSGQTWHIWYDTTNNIVNMYRESGSDVARTQSLPIAELTITNGIGVVSIDQVFNGFGYIGSTVFALPGVKGLAPNGRNTDGTLSNVVKTLTNVTTRDFGDRGNPDILYLNSSNEVRPWDVSSFNIDRYPTPAANKWYLTYSTIDNLFYKSDNGANYVEVDNICFFGKALCVYQGNITSFNTYKTFRAVDYNDTEYMAHQAMPSDKSKNLTLGASGSTYTAPTDGYVYFRKDATAVGQYFVLYGNNIQNVNKSATSGGYIAGYIPVKKGDTFKVEYNLAGSTTTFRFVYAQGAV